MYTHARAHARTHSYGHDFPYMLWICTLCAKNEKLFYPNKYLMPRNCFPWKWRVAPRVYAERHRVDRWSLLLHGSRYIDISISEVPCITWKGSWHYEVNSGTSEVGRRVPRASFAGLYCVGKFETEMSQSTSVHIVTG